MSANIRIDQGSGAGAGTDGQARTNIWLSQLVELFDVGVGVPSSRLWTLDDKPAGSAATMLNPTTSTASFTPDVVGTYKVTLARDGSVYGDNVKTLVVRVTHSNTGVALTNIYPLPAFLEKAEHSEGIAGQGTSGRGYNPLFDGIATNLRQVIIDNELGGTAEDVTAAPNTLVLRNGTGGIAATSLASATDLTLQASTCTADYNALICDVDTTITLRDGGADRAVVTTAAIFGMELNSGLTSFDLSWAQDPSAAGGTLSIAGQRGFGGFIGGSVKLASGKGGTLGTNLGGGIILELGQQVTNFTDKVSFREDSTEFFSVRRTGTTALLESPGICSFGSGTVHVSTITSAGTLNIGTVTQTSLFIGRSGAAATITGSSILMQGNSLSQTIASNITDDSDSWTARTAGGATLCTETKAAAYTEVWSNNVTSRTQTWAQATGAGGPISMSGQRGATSNDGGDITIAVGEGGTLGTNAPGDLILDLGTRVTAGSTGKLKIRANGAVVADFYETSAAFYWEPQKATAISTAQSFTISAANPYIQNISTGAGVAFYGSLDFYGFTFAEFAGQVCSDTNDVAFAASLTLNLNLSNHHRIGALTANITTLDASNLRDGSIHTVMVTQNVTGGWTVSFAAKFKFGTTFTSTVDTAANAVTIWTFLCDGTNLRCISKEVGLT